MPIRDDSSNNHDECQCDDDAYKRANEDVVLFTLQAHVALGRSVAPGRRQRSFVNQPRAPSYFPPPDVRSGIAPLAGVLTGLGLMPACWARRFSVFKTKVSCWAAPADRILRSQASTVVIAVSWPFQPTKFAN